MRRLLVAAVLLVASPALSRAASTVACHCYKDRTFDPGRPAAADPYVLATTRSSLLSAAYGASKAALVRAVMSGTSPDALWIAYWVSGRADRSASALLDAAGAGQAWKDVLAGAEGLGPAFDAALARGASESESELAALAVDDVLVARTGADAAGVRALRVGKASSEEVILATVLGRKTGAPGPQLLERIRSGAATWGTLLAEAGLAPEALDGLVRAGVR
ncbi:hypothetical protein [Anaeromyxobacter oryzae]|uniref:Lipoprotein n=1 Tax=Anaeromyxobacter oryzae TaxID=2918170 RepID=A0ABM7WNW5_9BACT|nr:hypothetical protein [Anaeromyxobacter oryzae]BDG01150.1 hypothetical protein AMOR_01460 [Anaeromyxobacter oryzae]